MKHNDPSENALKETTLKSEVIFQGNFLRIYKDDIQLADGTKSFREYIKHPGAALIVPVLANGNFLMVKQFRYAVGEVFIEFPAGKRDRNEDSSVCAHRELEEEVGYQAKTMTKMTRIYPAIGYSNEWIDLFLATDLTKTSMKLDHDERIEVIEVTRTELEQMIWDGKLSDVKTQIAAQWAFKNLRK